LATVTRVSWRQAQAWLRRRPLAADGLLAAALTPLQLTILPLSPEPRGLVAAAALTPGAMTFVAIRRRWPWLAVLGLAGYHILALLLFGWVGAGGLSLLVVSYTAAASMPLGSALVATGLLWAPSLAATITLADNHPDYLPDVPAWYLVAWTTLFALA